MNAKNSIQRHIPAQWLSQRPRDSKVSVLEVLVFILTSEYLHRFRQQYKRHHFDDSSGSLL